MSTDEDSWRGGRGAEAELAVDVVPRDEEGGPRREEGAADDIAGWRRCDGGWVVRMRFIGGTKCKVSGD